MSRLVTPVLSSRNSDRVTNVVTNNERVVDFKNKTREERNEDLRSNSDRNGLLQFFDWMNQEGSNGNERWNNIYKTWMSLLGAGIGASAASSIIGKLASSRVGQGAAEEFVSSLENDPNGSNDYAALMALSSTGAFSTADVGSGSNSSFGSFLGSLFGGNSNNGLLSGLLGISGQLGSSIFNMKNQKELIDYQNQYNTPANQMQRLADAGLNPNLMYSQGTTGNQSMAGSIAPVDFDTAQRENRMAKFEMNLAQKQFALDSSLKMANIDLFNSQAQEADERAYAQKLSNSVFLQNFEASLKRTVAETNELVASAQSKLQGIKESIQRVEESKASAKKESELAKLYEQQRISESELRDARKRQTEAQAQLDEFNSSELKAANVVADTRHAQWNSHTKVGKILQEFANVIPQYDTYVKKAGPYLKEKIERAKTIFKRKK